eukprot:g14079.t1
MAVGTSCPFYATNGTRMHKRDATPALTTVLKELEEIGSPKLCPAPLRVAVAEDAMKVVGLLNGIAGMGESGRRMLMNEMRQVMRRRMTGMQGADFVEGSKTANWIGEAEWNLMREEKRRLVQEQQQQGGDPEGFRRHPIPSRACPRCRPCRKTKETYAAHFNMAEGDEEEEARNWDTEASMDASMEANADKDAREQEQDRQKDYKNDDPCCLNFLAATDDLANCSKSAFLSDEEWHRVRDDEGGDNASELFEELGAELDTGALLTVDEWTTEELQLNTMSLQQAENIAQAARDFLNLSNPYQLGLSKKLAIQWELLFSRVDHHYGANPFSRSDACTCSALKGEEGADGKFLFHPVAELAAAQESDTQTDKEEGVNASNQTTTFGVAGAEGEEPRPRSMSDGMTCGGGSMATKGRKITRESLMRGKAANSPPVQKKKDAKTKNKAPPCPT